MRIAQVIRKQTKTCEGNSEAEEVVDAAVAVEVELNAKKILRLANARQTFQVWFSSFSWSFCSFSSFLACTADGCQGFTKSTAKTLQTRSKISQKRPKLSQRLSMSTKFRRQTSWKTVKFMSR